MQFMHCVRARIICCYGPMLVLMALTGIPRSAGADNGAALELQLSPDQVFYLPVGSEKEMFVGLVAIRNTRVSGIRLECRQGPQSVEIAVTALDRSASGDPVDAGKTETLLKWKGTPVGTFKGSVGNVLSIPLDKVGLPAISLKIVPARRSPLPDGGPFCAVQRTLAAPGPGACMAMGALAACCRASELASRQK